MVNYTYSLSSNFGNALDEGQLHTEILASAIAGNFTGIVRDDDTVTIMFSTSLSGGEQTTLNGLVSGHVKKTRMKGGNTMSLKATNSTSATYQTLWTSIYPGVGNLNTVKFISYMDTGMTSYDVRLMDVTNNHALGSKNLSNTTSALNDLGSISNLPTDMAAFELQVKRNGGSAQKNIYVMDVILLYE